MCRSSFGSNEVRRGAHPVARGGLERSWWAFCLAAVTLAMVGCAPEIMVPRQKPAEINLRGIKRVAITGIEGSGGKELEGQILEQLQGSNRFELVERAQLDKVKAELGLGSSVEFREGDTAIGKLLPAAAIIWGHVDRADFDQTNTSKAETCTRSVKQGKKKVSQSYPCKKNERTGKVSIAVQLRVFDTNTARILAAKTLNSQEEQHEAKTDEDVPPIDGEALKEHCRHTIAEDFVKVIAPHVVQEKVKLTDDSSLPDIKQGNEYLKRGDSQAALELYGKALAKANGDATVSPKAKARAYYAHGLGSALVGDYQTAVEEIRTANMGDSNSDWLDMEVRVKRWQEEAKKVDEQRKAGDATADTTGTPSPTDPMATQRPANTP